MENRLKYEDDNNYTGLKRYDATVSKLASNHRVAKKELKEAMDAVDERYTKSEIKKLEQAVQVSQEKLTTYISSISQKYQSSKPKSTSFQPVSKESYEI